MESHLTALTVYFSAHSDLALAAIFAASLLEALAVVGTFIPGSSIVFAGGVLIGWGLLNPWAVAIAALLGAILGDGISYWLGHHYRERIRTVWPCSRFPKLLERGQAYFSERGAHSVFFGRFLGPVRAIVPVVAGMTGMPAGRFYLANISSAFGWVALHLGPGILFGASLQLAGAVSSRLLILLLIVGVFIWAMSWLVRFTYRIGWPYLKTWRARVLAQVQRKPGRLARIALSLLDPANAQAPARLTGVVLLIASGWLFFSILEDVVTRDPLVQLDQTIYRALQGLRTEWGDHLMLAVSQLSGMAVTVAVVASVAIFFISQRHWRTLGYWLTAAGVAEIVAWSLKTTLARVRPHNPAYLGIEQFSFPSGHTMLGIVVYGFLAFLLARGSSLKVKTMITLASAVAIGLIGFSRLYLGAHWFSDVLASLSLGLAWLALLSLAYTPRVRNEPVRRLPLLLLVATTIVLAGGWTIGRDYATDLARYESPPAKSRVLSAWQAAGWQQLPAARADLDGTSEEPFSVQWAAPPAQVSSTLLAAGWQTAPPWTMQSALLWLLPETPIAPLPVLPKFDHGAPPKLTLVKVLDRRHRLVLRLWPSVYSIDSAAATAVENNARPLWLGTATVERLHAPLRLISLIKTEADFSTPLRILKQDAQNQRVAVETREARGRSVLLVW